MRFKKVLVILLAVAGNPAVAADLLVPGDYVTIQEAVDAAAPGDVIYVGPGLFVGAEIDKRLTIIGSTDTVINMGVTQFRDGFFISGDEASGSTIRDMTIIGDMTVGGVAIGIFSSDADNVIVTNNVFLNTNTAIDIRRANGWIITDNIIDGLNPLAPFDPGFGNVNNQDGIEVWGAARDNYIVDNWIRHVGERNPDFDRELSAGIELIGIPFGPFGLVENNIVEDNHVEIFVENPLAGDESAGILLVAIFDPAAVTNNLIVDNDLCNSLTPIDLIPGSLGESNFFDDNKIVCDDDDDD